MDSDFGGFSAQEKSSKTSAEEDAAFLSARGGSLELIQILGFTVRVPV